jgi:hypothetical protein
VPLDHLGQPAEARGRPLLLDQDGRVDLARRIIERDDEVERRPAGEPGVRRAILEQHHARQRPAWPFLAVRRALRRALDQAGLLQDTLRPGVAQLEGVLGDQSLVEMLGREIPVARAVLLQDPFDPIDRHTPPRGTAAAPVEQALGARRLVAIAQAPEVPLAHPQRLRRLDAAQRPTPIASDRLDDPGHSDLR